MADPVFIHVGSEDDFAKLRDTPFVGVNVCTLRPTEDKGGWWLIYLGERTMRGDAERYSGHRYIIRCRDTKTRDEAEKLLRATLKLLEPRHVR